MRRAAVIPIAIIVLTVIAFASARTYRVPTFQATFDESRPATVKTVEYVVDGLRCRGTAAGFARMVAAVPGVVGLTAYASTHMAIVEYDPAMTDPNAIARSFTARIVRDGRSYEVFKLVSQRDLD